MRAKTRAQRIHQLEQELEREREALFEDIAADNDDGVPVTRLAQDTGISRTTIHRRLRERRESDLGKAMMTEETEEVAFAA